MKKLITVILIALGVVSCTHVKEKSFFRIKGTFERKPANTEKIILITQTKEINDTVKITSNSFEFKGKVSEPTNAAIVVGKKSIRFPLVNDEIEIRIINIENNEFEVKYKNSKVKENLQSYYYKESKEYIDKYKLFEEQKVKSDNDNVKYKMMLAEDSLAIDFIHKLIHNYKTRSDKSGFSIILNDLKGLIGTRNHPEEIEKFFKLLPVNEQNGFYGTGVKTYLEGMKKISPGQKINFDFVDNNRNHYSLDEFKGKLVLLEFWATWCGPCIAQIPSLKKVSEKKNKIQIISISIDKDISKWKNKIDELKMDWINIRYKQKNIDLRKHFFVTYVPYNILISQDGEILRKNISMNDLLEILN